MKTIAMVVLPEGYREELIKVKNGTYYRIKRIRKGDSYKLYKNNSKYGQPEYDELLDFWGLTLKEVYNEIKRLEK